MKKTKIISLIFVCAFLVLTFCCSFAGKMVDVEVKPPLGAFPGVTVSSPNGLIIKVDFSVLSNPSSPSNWIESNSLSITSSTSSVYIAINNGAGGGTFRLYDSLGNLLRESSSVVIGRVSGGSFGIYNSPYASGSTLVPNEGVYYIEIVNASYFYFNYGTNQQINLLNTLSTAPILTGFLSYVTKLPTLEPIFSPGLFFDNLMLGISGTAEEIGLLFSNLGFDLFISVVDGVNQLSVFGTVVAIMLGVSITLGLCNFVFDYILTLGRKKR